jgi:pyruvate kinase
MDTINKENMAIDKARKLIVDNDCVKSDDIVIFAAGAPHSENSRVNWLRIDVIK